MFDSSELASIVWVVIILTVMVIYKPFRISFWSLIKIIFKKNMLMVLASIMLYTFFSVILLYKLDLWDFTLIKEVLLWFVFSATMMVYKLANNNKAKIYFVNYLNENFTYTLAVEFIIGLYTFSVLIEFLIVPIIFFIGILIAYSNKGGNEKINRFLKGIIMIIVLTIIGSKILHLTLHYGDYLKTELIKQFLIAPLLSLLFIPFLFLLHLYINYERIFTALEFAIKQPDQLRYAKHNAIRYFKADISGLDRWKDSLFNLTNVDNEKILTSIFKIKSLQNTEKRPPEVSINLGWSPYSANKFLRSKGLETSFYFNYSEDFWHCSSHVYVGEDVVKNNIGYYINGTERIATSLKLILNVHDMNAIERSYSRFIELVATLYDNALNENISEDIAEAIINRKDYCEDFKGYEVSIKKNVWNFNKGNFNVTFEIRHKSHIDY